RCAWAGSSFGCRNHSKNHVVIDVPVLGDVEADVFDSVISRASEFCFDLIGLVMGNLPLLFQEAAQPAAIRLGHFVQIIGPGFGNLPVWSVLLTRKLKINQSGG